MLEQCDIAIVGGGISGLATAYALSRRAPALRCLVLEAGAGLGGAVRTEVVAQDDGRFVVEHGPDSVLTQKPWALDLLRELGLGDQLLPIARLPQPVGVLRDGHIRPFPPGMALFTPTDLRGFARSPVLTPLEKARAALDLVRPARAGDADESLGAFARRRFGPAILAWLAEPIAAGIYNADPNEQSLLATFPALRAQEREHGSLIRAARAAKRARGTTPQPPPFVTLCDGMRGLADALVARIGDAARTNVTVHAITGDDGTGFLLQTASGPTVAAHAVVLATPAAVAATLLSAISPDAGQQLGQLRARPAGSLSAAFPTAAITRPLPGYGLVVPAGERRPINAVTVASRKFPGRAPEGWTLLRVFFGGARSPGTAALPAAVLIETVMTELRSLLGVEGDPAFVRIARWDAGSPQYDVGHLDRVAAIEAALPPGIAVVGSPYRGVGLPDVIHQASVCADRIAESINRTERATTTYGRTHA